MNTVFGTKVNLAPMNYGTVIEKAEQLPHDYPVDGLKIIGKTVISGCKSPYIYTLRDIYTNAVYRYGPTFFNASLNTMFSTMTHNPYNFGTIFGVNLGGTTTNHGLSPYCTETGTYDESAPIISVCEMQSRGMITHLVVIGWCTHNNTVGYNKARTFMLRDTRNGKTYRTYPMRGYMILGQKFIPTPIGYRHNGEPIMPDEDNITMYRGQSR